MANDGELQFDSASSLDSESQPETELESEHPPQEIKQRNCIRKRTLPAKLKDAVVEKFDIKSESAFSFVLPA